MSAAESYLRLSSAYCEFLGGLRWSAQQDALEYPEGPTLAVAEEVALFLEGFAAGGRLIHFNFVVHLLALLGNHQRMPAPGSLRLSHNYADTGRRARNAGAFCSVLCRDIPEVSGSLCPHNILDQLRHPYLRPWWYTVRSDSSLVLLTEPPLPPQEFEQRILKELEAYRTEELREWLRHGRGPIKAAGEALARALPPRTLTGALAALLERPRLAGARPFVAQLLSALALPPRRWQPTTVALGGYADVTTHGQPHELLPSQFALDEWDFLRRYADHELLYFRREQPHEQTQHELVVVLDQGVRTWGDVRLVLGAAVLALGRQAALRHLRFIVATTGGRGELIDPLAVADDTLGQLVEASDLSANPGLALERVLEQPAAGSRDVVLLTHPRNLDEEAVRTAALRSSAETRLLGVGLDERGAAALCDLRHGLPVVLRQFQVDLCPAATAATAPAPGRVRLWSGDIEPIGFPFRFGTGGLVQRLPFDLDFSGHWLLTATHAGLLHLWKTDGTGHMEMLPRAIVQGVLLEKVDAVMGLMGGFLVAGHGSGRVVVAHYDLQKRTCTGQLHGEVQEGYAWAYRPELRGFVYRGPGERQIRCALAEGSVPPGHLPVMTISAADRSRTRHYGTCYLDTDLGLLCLLGAKPHWEPFIPLADGLPVLAGCSLLDAQCRGNVLAVRVQASGQAPTGVLRLFRVPERVPLAERPAPPRDYHFALSGDGRLLAQQTDGSRVEVVETEGAVTPLVATYASVYSGANVHWFEERFLVLRTGQQHFHKLQWADGVLHVEYSQLSGPTQSDMNAFLQRCDPESLAKRNCEGSQAVAPNWVNYDTRRFELAAKTTVTAVFDSFGQVAILDVQHNLVCMFFVFRSQLSAWLPDGTSFGPASPSGRPPTAEDLTKFGQALAQASDRGRSQPCK